METRMTTATTTHPTEIDALHDQGKLLRDHLWTESENMDTCQEQVKRRVTWIALKKPSFHKSQVVWTVARRPSKPSTCDILCPRAKKRKKAKKKYTTIPTLGVTRCCHTSYSTSNKTSSNGNNIATTLYRISKREYNPHKSSTWCYYGTEELRHWLQVRLQTHWEDDNNDNHKKVQKKNNREKGRKTCRDASILREMWGTTVKTRQYTTKTVMYTIADCSILRDIHPPSTDTHIHEGQNKISMSLPKKKDRTDSFLPVSALCSSKT